METSKTLTFKVARKSPELIAPAKPTPHELKLLSDIDDQEGLRFQIPIIHFYRKSPSAEGKDPVEVIRDAIGKALVFYYPFAGRLKEDGDRKLAVECTGEGVVFIEADADVTLQQFGGALQPPFACLDEILYDPAAATGVLDSPLLLIQVTRLKCGGFIFALRLNHTMTDAFGLVQFLRAVGELACGGATLSTPPIWERHIFQARNPPRVTCTHREYDAVEGTLPPLDDMVHRSFFFGEAELSALRSRLPPHLRGCTAFDLLTACLWRCRTIAISPESEEEVKIICIVNARRRFNPPIPAGYYGNSFAFAAAVSAAGELSEKPLGYAVELVREAKGGVTEEYMKSVADMMVIRGRPHFAVAGSFLVSDVTRMGFGEVDFGWGKPVYGGPAKAGVGAIPGIASFYIPFKNIDGENGIVVPICLPGNAMEVFVKELDSMLKTDAYELSPKM